MSVNSGRDPAKIAAGSDVKKPPKKKRKKAEDDFIVEGDYNELDEDLIELSDCETYGRPERGFTQPRSLKRPRMTRNKNVIVLSGPHGCGKSAMVYAVAKELEFDVFEISSSSRRSGKDIQDRVGDMTENHLVNHKRDKPVDIKDQASTDETETEHIRQAFQEDLQSGRQGTMTSFFTSKSKASSKPKVQPKVQPKALDAAKSKPISGAQPTLFGSTRKTQKQSLILLEEADILFEEDQQFWFQVNKIASQSKRPIVITCNNEQLIPMHEMPLAAVLRLGPPPTDLAVDYLLLLAAREGHILKRKAVLDLFRCKNNDLRASITELNFWCQMSVGDRKGGLEWVYQRWPPGKDVNEQGRLLRVASEGTYQSGMGCFSHDVAMAESSTNLDKEEELAKQLWESWAIKPELENKCSSQVQRSAESPSGSLAALKQFDRIAESASAADVYCRVGLPSYEADFHEPTDPTLPPITAKESSNFTEAAPIIQIDHLSDFSTFDTNLYISSQLQIQRCFELDTYLKEFTGEPGKACRMTEAILDQKQENRTQKHLSRPDFSDAFDILASPPSTTATIATSYQLTASTFDRTFRIVAEDLAPYVRSIVAHELRLDAQRIRLGNLLSEGGTGKRGRTTRASRTALEGGRRETKRREQWFDKDLNKNLVMATAGSWAGLGTMGEDGESVSASASRTGDSLVSAQEDRDDQA